MAKARMAAWLWVGCLLHGSATWAAQPTVADLLNYRPHQEGVVYTTPSPQEQTSCTRELIKGKQRGSGWLVRDSQGRKLRVFFDTNGDGHVDIWSYFRDGVEVYREIDSNFRGKPDQFRWLNSGGMKWGVDVNDDFKIDTWKTISAEEVSQEILQALIGRDFARLQALFITDAELKTLDFSATEVSRIHELQKQAFAKFQTTLAKLTHFNDKTHWVHLETGAPQCILPENAGSKHDLIRYARASILCETGGKHDWLQAGELIQVGLAWRIIDAPTVGDGGGDDAATATDPALQGLLSQLGALDAHPPSGSDIGTGASPELATYNLKRADLLDQIVAKVKPEEREQWTRQVADCLAAAAQSSPESDKTAYKRLQTLEDQVVTSMPKSGLAAYITFREMSAENALLAKSGTDNAKVQDKWLERLAKFVDTYPRAEDTPEALMQLGMFSEVIDKEMEAKKWYAHLVHEFADHPLAAKAQGALRRLELEGKVLALSGSQLDGSPFNVADLRGKMVVIYYWGGWNKQRCVGDFATLKLLQDTYAGKLAVVCISLDNTVNEARAFLQQVQAPGIHLFQPGGLDSPLATQYGIMFLPHLFLVDNDGKVLSRSVQQVSGLESELKKHLK
jgi:hypothetical protein